MLHGILCVVVLFAVSSGGTQRTPNILLLMADDMGYGDLGCFGNTTLRTPNLDKLVTQGTKMTHSLAAASICTPSRAAFLTGRYPIRAGMAPTHNVPLPIFTACDAGLLASELTVAEVAKTAGYATAILGKWHLGWSDHRADPDHMHPLNQGFDYFYGLPLTNMKDFDRREEKMWRKAKPPLLVVTSTISLATCICGLLLMWMGVLGRCITALTIILMLTSITVCGFTFWLVEYMGFLNSFVFRNYELVEQPIDLASATRKLVFESSQFLESRHADGRPFLLFVSWLHTHTALVTGPQFQGRSQHGAYGDTVEELDWGVGQLMEKLDSLGLTDNTLVYFTSDNGGHVEELDFTGHRAGGYNSVFKGGKAHGSPDGGIRMPTIIRWPNNVPAGHVIDEPVSLMDVLPTVAHVLNVSLPEDLVIDGHNLLPLLTGQMTTSPHEFLFHYCQEKVHAVRYRPRTGSKVWKMVLYEPNYLPGKDYCEYMCMCNDALPLDPPHLYDMTSDPGERHPLLDKDLKEYPALVKIMREALAKHSASILPVPNVFSFENLMWKPWKQPFCNFPRFKCEDNKFKDMFKD